MNVINVIGDALFIFGFHWSVAGAAGASLISRMTACFILMWRLRDPKLDIRIGTTKGVNMRMVKQILHIGIPNGIENSIFQLAVCLQSALSPCLELHRSLQMPLQITWTVWAFFRERLCLWRSLQ